MMMTRIYIKELNNRLLANVKYIIHVFYEVCKLVLFDAPFSIYFNARKEKEVPGR